MDFRENIKKLRGEVLILLPKIEDTPVDKISEIFLTYDALIRPNFIMWLMLNKPNLKSNVAIKACKDNLDCEITDNHPQMLLNFMEPIIRSNINNAEVTLAVNEKIKNSLRLISKITELSTKSLEGLYIMAILENTSVEFIAWMKKASAKLDLTNKRYLDVHGEADIEHADEFINAIEAESKKQKKPL